MSSSPPPMMHSMLCNALHLNNQAAALIADGSYVNAISSLTAALVQLKQATARASSCEDCLVIREMTVSPRSARGTMLRFLMRSSLRDKEDDGRHDEWYLHRHPVQVTSITGLDIENTSQAIEILSFASIYNMALCHHLQAISSSPNLKIDSSRRQLQMRRATTFYEHAQRLLLSTTATIAAKSSPGDDDDTNLMTTHAFLVVANNLGHAYYFLGNESNGKLCFQRLWNAILYLTEHNRGSSSETVQSRDKNLWGGLMENITHHLIGTSSHAAAA